MTVPHFSVLLIEDNPGDARLIREMLSEHKQFEFDVTVADRLSAGLKLLGEHCFDTILLDLSLPDSHGLVTLSTTLGQAAMIPVVVLTGLDDHAIGLEAVHQGAEDYLVKGEIDHNSLPRILRYAIERKHTERDLRESRQFLESTLDALSAHIAVLDETGTVVAVNETWRRFADQNGLDDPTYGLGRNYLTLCDDAAQNGDEDARAVAIGIRHNLSGQVEDFYREYPCHAPDQQRWFMMRLSHFEIGDSVRVIVAHQDISERILAEYAERDQRQLAEVLSQTAAIVNQTLELADVLDSILSNVERVVPHDAVYVLEVDGTIARTARAHGFERYGLEEKMGRMSAPIKRLADLNYMYTTQRPMAIPNILQDANWLVLPETAWARSFAGAPICNQGNVVGFLGVLSAQPERYTQEHADRLWGLANQVGTALHNAQMYQELARQNDYLEEVVAIRTMELQDSEAKFRQLAEHIREVFWIANADTSQLEYVSPAYEDLWERPLAVLYRNAFDWMEAVHPDDRQRVIDEARGIPLGTYDSEYRIVLADGTIRWIRDRGFPVHDRAGHVVRITGIAEDITESKQSTLTLQQALAREIEINVLRSRFVSMASHDLRTPLAVLQSQLELLEYYSDRLRPEDRQGKFAHMKDTIGHMVELLDDILIVGRAESNHLELNLAAIDVRSFCLNTLNDIRSSIGVRHLFDFSFSGDSSTIPVDPKLFRHVLTNLLSNAVKYSPENSTVHLHLLCDEAGVQVRIRDEGIGIPHSEQQRLFDPFWRASNVGSTPGTGLGLVIVKQSVELHGGTIAVESAEGTGTTFTVIIPRHPAARKPGTDRLTAHASQRESDD